MGDEAPVEDALGQRGQKLASKIKKINETAKAASPPPKTVKTKRDGDERKRAALVAEIKRLQREIKDMERSLEASGAGSDSQTQKNLSAQANMEKIMEHLLQQSNEAFVQHNKLTEFHHSIDASAKRDKRKAQREEQQGEAGKGDRDKDMDRAAAHIQALASITGISFSDVTSALVRDAEQGELRRYSLSGSCMSATFSMELDVQEATHSIKSLSITVGRSEALELEGFTEYCQATRSPQAFFTGIVEYGKLQSQRKALLQSMLREFPRVVTCPTGAAASWSIRVVNEDAPSFGFLFTWRIQSTDKGKIRSYIDLHPIVTPQFLVNDTEGIAESAPEQFRHIVELKGLDDALRTMVSFVNTTP